MSTTNCITIPEIGPGLLGSSAYLGGGVSPHALHIEVLPGGFLVGVSGDRAAYTRQIFASSEALVEFVRAWTTPKP